MRDVLSPSSAVSLKLSALVPTLAFPVEFVVPPPTGVPPLATRAVGGVTVQVVPVPGAGLKVPIWILGSSLFGAQLAAIMGLPFAFASHFAPALMSQAVEIYRGQFRPSEHLEKAYVMLGLTVVAADTDIR